MSPSTFKQRNIFGYKLPAVVSPSLAWGPCIDLDVDSLWSFESYLWSSLLEHVWKRFFYSVISPHGYKPLYLEALLKLPAKLYKSSAYKAQFTVVQKNKFSIGFNFVI